MEESQVAVQEPVSVKVTEEYVRSLAKSRCRYCSGTGVATYVVSAVGAPTHVKADGTTRVPVTCGCAQNRFVRRHSRDVELKANELCWKPGKEPRP